MATRLGRTLAAGVNKLKERASSSADGSAPTALPYVVETVIAHIEKKELNLEGIFRVSGSLNDVKQLKASLEKRRNVDLTKVQNPHSISGVLKLWLRELPRPPMTFELYDAWRVAGSIESKKSTPLAMACMKEAWRALPAFNQVLLTRLFLLLHEVAKNAEVNKMPAANLAIVFGPTLLRPEQETVETMLGDAESIARVMETYITQTPFMLDGATPAPAELAGAPPAFAEALARGRLRLTDASAPLKASASRPTAPLSPKEAPSAPPVVVVLAPEERAALRLQAAWRGYRVRRRIANLPGGRALAAAAAVACGRLRTRHMGLVSCIAELKSYAAIMRSSLLLVPPSASPLAAAAAARAASSNAAGQGPVALSEPLALEAEVRTIFNGVDSLNEAHLAVQARLNKLAGQLPWELREPGALLEECVLTRLDAWEEFRAGFAAARRTLLFVMHSRPQSRRWMETMQGRSVTGLHLLDLLHEPVRQLVEHVRLLAGVRDALMRFPHRPFSIDVYRAARAATLWQRVAQAAGHVDNLEAEQELLMTEKTIVGAKEAGFIVRPGRRLVRKGEVKIASEKRFVFLFNDLCLVTKQEGLSYHFKYVVELMGASVSAPPRAGGKHAELSIELATPDRPYLIVLRNADECRAWAKDLEDVTAHIAARLVGVPLQDLLSRDRRASTEVPRAFAFLLEQLAQPVSSLFMLQPPADDVAALRERLERGAEAELVRRAKEAGASGQHQVAALLCTLLESLPEPLLPAPAPAPDAAALGAFVRGLSAPHLALLRAVVHTASRVPMPALDVPAHRLLALALLPCLAPQYRATIASALAIDAAEQALALLIENPALLSASPPAAIATTSLGQPSVWASARLGAKPSKPLPRAPLPASASSEARAAPSGSASVSASASASISPSPSYSAPPPPLPVSVSVSASASASTSPPVVRALPARPMSPPLDVPASPPRGDVAATAASSPAPTSPANTTRRNVRPLPVPGAGLTSPTRRGATYAGTPPQLPLVSVDVEEKRKRERGAPVVGGLGAFISEEK